MEFVMRLSHGDWNQISNFLQDLYAQTDAARFPDTLLTGLARLIPCENLGYNDINSRTNQVTVVVQPFVSKVFELAPVLESMFHEHPQLAYYRANPDRQAYQFSDFLSARQFQQTGIYQEFYRHIDAEHQIALVLSEQGATSDIGIAINRKHRAFSERDRAVLDHLRPHLIRARQNALVITQAEERVQSLTGTLDTVRAGLALVDNAGRVTWITPQTACWLEIYFPNSRKHPDRLPEELERWLQAQLKVLSEGSALAKAPTTFVAHQHRSALTVRCHPVQDGATRLIFSEKRELLAADRARELGLTAREAEVLHWIGEGKNNPEIAVLLRLSPRTVHKHVEHILAKLGVETRYAAIRHVSEG
jgi:DNA-binding CsgD family transcriptional regulator